MPRDAFDQKKYVYGFNAETLKTAIA